MNLERALREAGDLLAAEADRPHYIVLSEPVYAVFCVCGFLRWGWERSYSVGEWAEECDIYLLVHPENAAKGRPQKP